MMRDNANVLPGRSIRAVWSNKFTMGLPVWSLFEVHLERSFNRIPNGYSLVLEQF